MKRFLTTSMVLSLVAAAPAWAGDSHARLQAVLDAQTDEVKARYAHRHPAETLGFFGIQPGMTVVEVLPGGGWYSRILADYLGQDGHLIGADYAQDMFPLFGFFSDEAIAARENWVETWTAEATEWGIENPAQVSAFRLGSLPEDMRGTADAVLFIRALHNLARFETQGAYLSAALKDAWDALKPGGVLGVVQHRAPADHPEESVTGARGYLRTDFVIQRLEAAGFVFEEASEINANPMDQPSVEDVVWRLPPTLATSRDNEELKAQLTAIGESDRMTLRFRKPE